MPFKNPEKRKEYIRQWQRANPDKVRRAGEKFYQQNPKKKMLKHAKTNAKARGLDFSITEEDLPIPDVCPYLDIPLDYSSVSIDRIDSSMGYVKGNVQVMSKLANLMKSNATQEQLVTFAKNVLKQHEVS